VAHSNSFLYKHLWDSGAGRGAIIVTMFYKEAKDDPIMKRSALPQNKEKTLKKKSLKIELESF